MTHFTHSVCSHTKNQINQIGLYLSAFSLAPLDVQSIMKMIANAQKRLIFLWNEPLAVQEITRYLLKENDTRKKTKQIGAMKVSDDYEAKKIC